VSSVRLAAASFRIPSAVQMKHLKGIIKLTVTFKREIPNINKMERGHFIMKYEKL
jgi:hypothetical protein